MITTRRHAEPLTTPVRVMIAAAACAIAPLAGAESWQFIPSPNGGSFENRLFGADASSAQDVWAVGVSTNALLDRADTLAMRWDGEAWTIVPTPNPNAALQSNRLADVAVIAPDDAWAVGSSTFGPFTSPLLLHWNGSAWSIDDGAAGLPPSSARAVHAIAPDDVWVVGFITQPAGFATLAAHYDGSDWTATNMPNAQFGGMQFEAIHGLASDDIWAAGYENPGNGVFAPLLAHWDGSEWTTLNPAPLGGCTLHGVAMIASDDAWAVGRCPVSGLGDQPYAVHWDGESWTPAEMPIIDDGHARLEGVVARAADDVWAAGTNGTIDGIPRPFIMHFDGVAWQEVSTPASGGSHEWFHDMAIAPSGELWAVG
ncbi:MAG: hypothetical protein KDA25_04470, partial [Phycisphaerales bacterium]|nr:hypothetical protein [Phycisphaerales bacterium]